MALVPVTITITEECAGGLRGAVNRLRMIGLEVTMQTPSTRTVYGTIEEALCEVLDASEDVATHERAKKRPTTFRDGCKSEGLG